MNTNLEVALYAIRDFRAIFSIIKPQGVAIRITESKYVCCERGKLKVKHKDKLPDHTSQYREIDNKQFKVMVAWLNSQITLGRKFENGKEFLNEVISVLKNKVY